jgi:hypothetical protein
VGGAEIKLFHLSGYSAERDPREGISGDLKQAVTRQQPARSKAQLKRAVVDHMRKPPRSPAGPQPFRVPSATPRGPGFPRPDQ